MQELINIENQKDIEARYSRKQVDLRVRQEILESTEIQEKVLEGVHLLEEWMDQPYYTSKKVRLSS